MPVWSECLGIWWLPIHKWSGVRDNWLSSPITSRAKGMNNDKKRSSNILSLYWWDEKTSQLYVWYKSAIIRISYWWTSINDVKLEGEVIHGKHLIRSKSQKKESSVSTIIFQVFGSFFFFGRMVCFVGWCQLPHLTSHYSSVYGVLHVQRVSPSLIVGCLGKQRIDLEMIFIGCL